MNAEEIKAAIKEKGVDRRALAVSIGVSPSYLGNVLNGWALLKQSMRDDIEKFLKK